MKKKFLFTLVMAVSLCVGVQAQEFRYGLSGGYNYNSTKEVFPDLVFMPD